MAGIAAPAISTALALAPRPFLLTDLDTNHRLNLLEYWAPTA